MPDFETLRAAARCNPHGFGFVSSNGIYWRGLDFNELVRQLRRVGKEDACIIHFRYATHGSHKKGNCHPFRSDDLYFAHNGVLPVRTYNDMTDSETVFRNVLVPVAKRHGIFSPIFERVVENEIHSSRFAFMQNGVIRLFGHWQTTDGGLVWSNLNFTYYLPNFYQYTPAWGIR